MAVLSQPLIVFIHGFRDRPEIWGRVITELALPAEQTLVVALKPAAGAGQALAVYAAQVTREVLGHTASGGRVVLVGHSMGAAVAELVAAELGMAVAGLMLITPASLGGHDLPAEVLARFRAACGEHRAEFIGKARRAQSFAVDDEGLAIMVRGAQATPEDFAVEQLVAWTGGTESGRHPSAFPGPVLIVGASGDGFFTEDYITTKVAPRFRLAQTASISAAGHWPQIEEPAEVAKLLTTFAARLQA